MPPLIAAALIGAGLYVGARLVRQVASRMAEHSSGPNGRPTAGPAADHAERDLGRLEVDPATGVYRPAQDRG